MDYEKVSIIIPVYKVELYLNRCVESVLRQTYANFEVLLVDDGSPDSCGTMCDQWAEKDPRIRVIHKENGGLSDARNAGLDNATGEYIVFVDSDDYIAPDMVKNLYSALKASDADMSICNICYVDEQGTPLIKENRTTPIKDEVLTGYETIIKECDYNHKGWYYVFTWNKLYKKTLFSEIRFPKGKLSEDDYTSHRVFALCEKVACTSAVGYYYTQRTGSIIHRENSKLFLHQAEGRLARAVICNELGLYRSAGLTYWNAAMALTKACKKESFTPDLEKELNDTILDYRQNIYLQRHCELKEKIQVWIIYFSPNLYRIVFRNKLRQNFKKLMGRG